MNTVVLIEALVRQTTVLIATLATAAGQRAPLSRIADQVFGDLVRELNDQGVGHKVIADMFGLALRTYHERVSRVAASGTDQGRSLWEAVFSHIEQHGPVSRTRLLHRFKNDDDATVRGVLRDLVESGLVYQTGRGDDTGYRAADPKEAFDRNRDPDTLDRFVQVAVYRHGPVERAKLSEILPIGEDALLDASLARLVAAREVHEDASGPSLTYDCATCVIPFGDASPALRTRRYHAFQGYVAGKELSFWITKVELWSDWCSTQTPHAFEGNGVKGFRCVPQDATEQNTDLGKLVLCTTQFDGDMCGSGVPCDCRRRVTDAGRVVDAGAGPSPLCSNYYSACSCTANGCTANLTRVKDLYAFAISGSTMRQIPSGLPGELRKVSP